MKNYLIYSFVLVAALFSCTNSTLTEKELLETDPLAIAKKEQAGNTLNQQVPETTTADSDVFVLMKTTAGNIKLKLYKETPLHQANFIKLVKDNFYNGVLFHRVIKGFMIQTGDPDSKAAVAGAMYGAGGPDYTIAAEILPQFYHKKGALAAARKENPEKRSSGSQFYIVQGTVLTADQLQGGNYSENAIKDYTTIGGSPALDGQYTVFGETVEGIDIVDKIAGTKTDQNDRPLKDVKVISIEITK